MWSYLFRVLWTSWTWMVRYFWILGKYSGIPSLIRFAVAFTVFIPLFLYNFHNSDIYTFPSIHSGVCFFWLDILSFAWSILLRLSGLFFIWLTELRLLLGSFSKIIIFLPVFSFLSFNFLISFNYLYSECVYSHCSEVLSDTGSNFFSLEYDTKTCLCFLGPGHIVFSYFLCLHVDLHINRLGFFLKMHL